MKINVEYIPSTFIANPNKMTWWKRRSFHEAVHTGGSGIRLTYIFVGAWEDEYGNEV